MTAQAKVKSASGAVVRLPAPTVYSFSSLFVSPGFLYLIERVIQLSFSSAPAAVISSYRTVTE